MINGRTVEVEIRGRRVEAKSFPLPFYKESNRYKECRNGCSRKHLKYTKSHEWVKFLRMAVLYQAYRLCAKGLGDIVFSKSLEAG